MQVRALLEELYRMEAKPALQTSSKSNEIDISATDSATHVYVKIDEPRGLSARFEGPYEIVSRPSRSQVEVRIGSYVTGEPRLATYHWSSCKVAHMRESASEGSRPKLGRPSKTSASSAESAELDPKPPPSSTADDELIHASGQNKPVVVSPSASSKQSTSTAKIQTSSRPVRSSRNPNPHYIDAMALALTTFPGQKPAP